MSCAMLKDIMPRDGRIADHEAVASPADSSPRSLRDIVLARAEPSIGAVKARFCRHFNHAAGGSDRKSPLVLDGKIRLYRLAPTGEEVFQGAPAIA